MASCVGCKKRTQSFCYVHKQSCCDDCSAAKCSGQAVAPAVQCDAICVIGNYFDWLADGDFTYPPRCTLCNRALSADASAAGGGVIRLVCKCLLHRECLRDHLALNIATQHTAQKDLKCSHCQAALVDPATQPRSKLRDAVAEFVGQVVRGESVSGSSKGSASSASAASPARARKDDDEFVLVGSASKAERYTPAVRDLMNKAAGAKAALPAGTAHTAVTLPSFSPPPSAVPTGAVSRSSASTASSAVSAASASSYPVTPSSSSSSSHSSIDIEAGVGRGAAEDHSKHKKSRFASLRFAQAGFRQRWCRPQRIVLLIMALAVFLSLCMYLKFGLSMMQGNGATPSPADAAANQRLSAEIVNAD